MTNSEPPDDDRRLARAKATIIQELVTAVEVIKSNYATKGDLAVTKEDLAVIKANYATKEELAVLSGKIDVLASNQQALQASLLAFQAHAMRTFATKAELADAVYQLTWRMAGFTIASVSATAALMRYL